MSELNFYLLQINDALFPIGAYSHSQGLETYIQRGIVHDEATAKEYIHHKIRWNLAFTELLAARLSYLAAAYGDLEQLLSIEEILEASRIPMEQREAARKMGSRFAKTIEKQELPVTKEENGIFRRYLTARKGQAINHCCIYGVFCAAMNIPLADALSYYLYARRISVFLRRALISAGSSMKHCIPVFICRNVFVSRNHYFQEKRYVLCLT